MEGSENGYEYLQKLREKSDGERRTTFRDYASYLENKARETGTPLAGQFELTPLCNFDCKMCYVHLEKDQLKGQSVLSTDQWKHLMCAAVDAGMLSATLTGGECLTYPGFDELYLYLQGLGCNVTVMTNGLLLDEKRIQFFQLHWPDGIQVTLYGNDDDAYERVTGRRVFQTVSRNVQMAVAAGLPITVSLTPNRYLGSGLLDTVRTAHSICKNVQINTMLFTPREETGRAQQQDDASLDLYIKALQLLHELRGNPPLPPPKGPLPEPGGPSHQCDTCGVKCGSGRSVFTITWQGKMVPCNRLEAFKGDPIEEGFMNAWHRINQATTQLPRVPECSGCPYETVCNPCAGELLRFTVPGKRPEKLCQRTIEYVRHGVWHIPGCE